MNWFLDRDNCVYYPVVRKREAKNGTSVKVELETSKGEQSRMIVVSKEEFTVPGRFIHVDDE